MRKMIYVDDLISKAKIEAQGMSEPFKTNFAILVEWLADKTPEAVVRCEDCIYWDTQDRGTVVAKCNYQSVARYLSYTDADDYCSHGERRTDG